MSKLTREMQKMKTEYNSRLSELQRRSDKADKEKEQAFNEIRNLKRLLKEKENRESAAYSNNKSRLHNTGRNVLSSKPSYKNSFKKNLFQKQSSYDDQTYNYHQSPVNQVSSKKQYNFHRQVNPKTSMLLGQTTFVPLDQRGKESNKNLLEYKKFLAHPDTHSFMKDSILKMKQSRGLQESIVEDKFSLEEENNLLDIINKYSSD